MSKKTIMLSIGGFHFISLDTNTPKNEETLTWVDTVKEMESNVPIADVAFLFVKINDKFYFAASNKSNASLLVRHLRKRKMETSYPTNRKELPLQGWRFCFGPKPRANPFYPYVKGYFINPFGIGMMDLDMEKNELGELRTWYRDNFLAQNLGPLPTVFYGTTGWAGFLMVSKEYTKPVFETLLRRGYEPTKPADLPGERMVPNGYCYQLHLGETTP